MPREALPSETRIFVQIAKRAQTKNVPPPLPAMFGCIVEHVAALAQGGEIIWRVAPRIVIKMRAGEHDIGRSDRSHV